MGQTDVGIELALREGSRIAGKSRSRRLDEDGQAKVIEAVPLDRLYTHGWPLRESVQQVRLARRPNHSGADELFGLTGIALFGVIGYLPCRRAVGIIYA